jgi:hypothetical protein
MVLFLTILFKKTKVILQLIPQDITYARKRHLKFEVYNQFKDFISGVSSLKKITFIKHLPFFFINNFYNIELGIATHGG